MKKCYNCNIEKPFEDYHKRTASKDGFDNQCKECRSRKNKSDDMKLKDYVGNFHNYERIGKHAEEVLTGMGFELYNDDNPVHIQFNRRIALKYGVILGDIKKGS